MSDELTLAELHERIDGVDIAMLTTIDERGTLSSRPLSVRDIDGDGHVVFLVDRSADWVVPGTHPANVAFVGDDVWVSVTGRLSFIEDDELIDELWDAGVEAWFADGRATVAVAHLAADRWEYWIDPSAAAIAFEVARATLTGGTPDVGASGAIEV